MRPHPHTLAAPVAYRCAPRALRWWQRACVPSLRRLARKQRGASRSQVHLSAGAKLALALWPRSPAAVPADAGGDAGGDAAQSGDESDGGGGVSGGGGRWPADPCSLLGRRVRRTFEGLRGVYCGVVRSTRLLLPDGPDDAPAPAQQVWGVAYADGDAEELYWHELLPFLVRLSDEHPAHVAPHAAAHATSPRKRARPPRPRRRRPPKHKGETGDGGGVVVKLPPHSGKVRGSSQSARAKDEDVHLRSGAPTQAQAVGKSAARGRTPSAALAAPAQPRGSSAAAARSRGGPVNSPLPLKLPAVKLETPPPPEREVTPCPSADGSEPPAVLVPAPQLHLAAAPDGAAAVQEFLRSITPPINGLERIVAAVPPRMTMAQLLRAVAKDTLPADREATVHCVASILGIDDASDKLQLLIELQTLARRIGS